MTRVRIPTPTQENTMKTKLNRTLWARVESLGCYWDATGLFGLSGDEALSAALSCHASHSFEFKHRTTQRDGTPVLEVLDKEYTVISA